MNYIHEIDLTNAAQVVITWVPDRPEYDCTRIEYCLTWYGSLVSLPHGLEEISFKLCIKIT